MASMPPSAGPKVEKLSFAKIAAAGLKSASAPLTQKALHSDTKSHAVAAVSQDASIDRASSNPSQPSLLAVQTRQGNPSTATNTPDSGDDSRLSPGVLVHDVERIPPTSRQNDAPSSHLLIPNSDDAGTQISSSSSSVKPSSLDGKSTASGTTFALDEKESLRPDDSASLKAVDDEDSFTASNAGRNVRPLGEEGSRTFNEQLQEIDSMGQPRQCTTPQRLPLGMSASRGMLYVPPQGPGIGHVPASRDEAENMVDSPPDPKLLEALDSPRDRIWVLKLEQDIFDFVKDTKEDSLDLPQCNAYHRMLAHKIADYYTLGHFVDDSASAVRLFKTPNLRIPPPLTGITTPSTAASTPPPSAPQMQILRRNDVGAAGGDVLRNGSMTNSENGESGNEDDKSKPVTREEREARYAAARLRIMGSSIPSDVPEPPVEAEESRSSSVAGKKGVRRKQRSNSEDGFEARSAFVHYAQPYVSFAQSPFAYPGYNDLTGAKMNSPTTYSDHDDANAFRRFPQQSTCLPAWSAQNFPHGPQTSKWSPATTSGYDFTKDFNSAMSLHNQSISSYASGQAAPYGTSYGPSYYPDSQAAWPQQNAQMLQQSQTPYMYQQYGQVRPTSSSSYGQEAQSYQFGQLPSQIVPGRPSSNLEHPLPGSYKSKHFDPQSQAFVPGGTSSFRAFTPQATPGNTYNAGYGFPSPLQRQGSSQSQASSFGSSHVSGGVALASHQPSPHSTTPHSMVHPLPQPVFPHQPSPNLPLPPKPYSSQRASPPHRQTHVDAQAAAYVPSSIAKWGAPASLPAKPPPPTEPFDTTRYSQMQRQPSYGSAAAARKPVGPPLPAGYAPPSISHGSALPVVVNGSNQDAQRST